MNLRARGVATRNRSCRALSGHLEGGTAGSGMGEALSGGVVRDAGCRRAGRPPYLYWVTAGLALAEQWNFTVLSSRTGCGSTDKFTRGGSAKRQGRSPSATRRRGPASFCPLPAGLLSLESKIWL